MSVGIENTRFITSWRECAFRVFFAAGVSLSDIIIVMLMLTVLQNFDLSDLLHNVYVASIGGAAIGFFGVLYTCIPK